MSRRLVVVLFLDLVGSTRLAERLDPEPLQQLLERYYEICSTAVEESGGVVEKFIGDAVMAVFGATRSREDDALRALRAAVLIRAGVAELFGPAGPAPELHCGVAAGEALVTRSSRAGLRVVGAVVNLAARLQSVAAAGEILVNDTVADLARAGFVLQPLPPLALRGTSGPVRAYRAIGAVPTAERAGDVRMVGRQDEAGRLRAAYRRVAQDVRGRVVLVLGPPGIGKTRLVRETVEDLAGATVAWAGCPSYGRHGDRRTLVQVLDAITRRPGPAADLVRTDRYVATVLADLHRASRRDTTAPGPGIESVVWAARELLAAAAAAGPVVVVWDGLERADRSLLGLLGHLVDDLSGRPVLTVAVGRTEVVDTDVPWLRALGADDCVEVRALDADDSCLLAASLAAAAGRPPAAGVVEQVADHSGGNPLFLRLMLDAALAGQPLGDVPSTVTALVGAMIDRMPDRARALLDAASVIGSPFTFDQLALLGEPAPGPDLDVLVARQVLDAGQDGYSFLQPMQDVAYGRLDKQRRLGWHRRLAEREISPAFHFEAATRLLGDLSPDDAQLPELARRAAAALLDQGTATLRQRDLPSAVGLLDRAWAVAPDGPQRTVAALRLSDALLLSGEAERAGAVVAALLEDSADARARRAGRVQQHLLALRIGQSPEPDHADLRAELDAHPDDRLAWCRFEQLRMRLHLRQDQFGEAERAVRAALGHARAAQDPYEEDWLLAAGCEISQWSPTPITEKLGHCAELAQRFAEDRFLLVPVLVARARCLALTGDPDGAEAALAGAGVAVRQLRLDMGRVLLDQTAGLVSSLTGRPAEAEHRFRSAADALDRFDHGPAALTMRVRAIRERLRLGPAGAEIAALLDRREEMDVHGRVLCLSTAARLGVADPATEIGDVLDLLDRTDDPCLRGEACFDLARAHRRRGEDGAARAMAGVAADSYAAIGASEPLRAVAAWR